jgi:hypothetical protein
MVTVLLTMVSRAWFLGVVSVRGKKSKRKEITDSDWIGTETLTLIDKER